MPNPENDEKFFDELFNFDFADDALEVDFSDRLKARKRAGVRYVRDDISVAICKTTPFSFGRETFIDFVELIDISSSGALVAYDKDILQLNDKVLTNLRFTSSGKAFKIKSLIVNKSYTTPYQYGIKFIAHHNELGDHLLETQRKLEFR